MIKLTFGKVIELFLINGTADSMITAELSNWNGKAIKVPRIEVASCTLEEITQAGVYFLFCKEDDGTDSVYIGEAENIKERLIQHIRDYSAGKESYYWNSAVFFIGRDLNKASIRYLENNLVETARSCKRYRVLTKNTYKNTVMKPSQVAAMLEFIENIKILINALGYKVLEPFLVKSSDIAADNAELLYITSGKTNATGKVTNEGFVLLSGSKISDTLAPNSTSDSTRKYRDQYTREGKIKDWQTTEDILFPSSSAASCFVLGGSSSGPRSWKNKAGYTLKEIEEKSTTV